MRFQVRSTTEAVSGHLANRLGLTYHRSPLLMRVRRLLQGFPTGADEPLGWLLDVANGRGLRIVSRSGFDGTAEIPGAEVFPDEELAVALCLLEHPDELQPLRVTAQMISAARLNRARLERLIICERVQPVLADMARQALKVAPDHADWNWILQVCGPPPQSRPLLHWTRLAEPVPGTLPVASGRWRLVA